MSITVAEPLSQTTGIFPVLPIMNVAASAGYLNQAVVSVLMDYVRHNGE